MANGIIRLATFCRSQIQNIAVEYQKRRLVEKFEKRRPYLHLSPRRREITRQNQIVRTSRKAFVPVPSGGRVLGGDGDERRESKAPSIAEVAKVGVRPHRDGQVHVGFRRVALAADPG